MKMAAFLSVTAERYYNLTLDSWQDADLGTVDGFGWYALFADDCIILEEDSNGFVSALVYSDPRETRAAWAELEEEWDEWLDDEADADLDDYTDSVFVTVEITSGPLY